MASFYSTQIDGSAVALALVPGPDTPPANAPFRKDFDASTNANVIAQFQTNPQLYQFVGNALNRDGIPVEFAPGGLYFEAKSQAAVLLAKAKQVKDGNASFSGEDLANTIAIAFHADGLPSS